MKQYFKYFVGVALLLFAILLSVFDSGVSEITIAIVYIGSYILIGLEVLEYAARGIFKGSLFNENFLIAIASIGAFAIGEYPEAVAVMLLYQIGEILQDKAAGKSRKSIEDLLELKVDRAVLLRDGELIEKHPSEIEVGAQIVVKAGERIPLDGILIKGDAAIDTSALTGESMPRSTHEGDEVLAGFINIDGLLTIEVTRHYSESTASKILEMVQESTSKKAKTERFITRVARVYTPVVVIVAALVAFLPPLFLSGQRFSDWLYRALIFLVVSCPCGVVISVPMGFFGGIGAASKHGILVKGSTYLENLRRVRHVVFDKTGTLTSGDFSVKEVRPYNNWNSEKLIEMTALCESFSNHHIATAVLNEFGADPDKSRISDYREYAGFGVSAVVDGVRMFAGNARLLEDEGVKIPSTHKSDGDKVGTIIYVAAQDQYVGQIIIADTIKQESEIAISRLRKQGIEKITMLTGDKSAVAESISNQLGLDNYVAELLPNEKVEQIEYFESDGGLTFVGDGINDAPVIARADVGVAMGGLGSDAAIEAADIVIMNDNPAKLATAVAISKKTHRIVWQNIVFAFAVKGIVMLLSSLGFASMWLAIFADVGVAILSILNSIRVITHKQYE
ncbi:MAG: heavy metal translocating P-type ATPase [Clostridiales bacterium]|nr:heavy metal translocating P-type ATPase [Clostridiales bacterium]